ncbi:hypothetical protein D6779_09965 [Candidatus Parcubacteria bacterium]|nr:MAG: hypothetical protein D6779_09965 [Candidatus Parcubacteria bacterium]
MEALTNKISTNLSQSWIWPLVLSWAAGNPLGWWIGWQVGAWLGRQFTTAPSLHNPLALEKEIAAFKWAPIGGLIGLFVAWTISAFLLAYATKRTWQKEALPVTRRHFWLLVAGWLVPACLLCSLCSLVQLFVTM